MRFGRKLALAAALAASTGVGARAADEPSAETPQTPASDAGAGSDPSLNPIGALDRAGLTGFRDKPLFTPSRRRPEPPPEPEPEQTVAPAAEPEAPAPNLKLLGVVDGPDGSVAIIENVDAASNERLRLGDSVSGWLVTDIDRVLIRLTLGPRDQEYRLFQRDRPAAAPPSDPAAEPGDEP